MTPSLLIGSEALGWQEFGDVAQLGVRTKAMPGGDGSLDFTVPGDFATKHRNVIVPEAVVKLTIDGEPDFGGYLTCDPLRHRLGAQDTLELVATGPWGMAGRDNRYSYLGIDPDPANWRQYRGINECSGRFTLDTEGRLEIRAPMDRSYGPGYAARLYWWRDDGLTSPGDQSGIVFEYKLRLPSTNWWAAISVGDTPDQAVTYQPLNNCLWQGVIPVTDWIRLTSQSSMYTCFSRCLMLSLWKESGTLQPPNSEPYIRLRFSSALDPQPFHGGVCGHYVDYYTPDNSISLADILTAVVNRIDSQAELRISGLDDLIEEFVAPYSMSLAAIVGQATLLAAAPVEAYFDLAPAGGFRFTANARPNTVDLSRNRLWSVGGRGGESLEALQRDWEATPEMVEVLYAVRSHATLPDGMVGAARYPASVSATYPLVETVDLTGEPPMTQALAAQYAQTIYTARQASLYAGDVTLAQTALTQTGQEVPTVKLCPGDRLGVPSRLDVPAAGLYVQHVAYDFRTARCTPTVGEPWDPLGFRPRTASRAVQADLGGFKGGMTRKGGGYRRRTGVV